ncbi:unnamed protein product [Closterium sp. Yama58-4]|nr:unnamed protein product [Closterium sp. Yama58-4]
MYDPLVSTTADLLVLLREFRVRPAIYMPVSDYVTCDEWLMEKAGVKLVTPTTPTSSGDEGEMCLPDGPLMRDERSRRRAIRNVTNAYVCHAEALGIAPAEVATVVGASDGEVVSRLSRTPKKERTVRGRRTVGPCSALGFDAVVAGEGRHDNTEYVWRFWLEPHVFEAHSWRRRG